MCSTPVEYEPDSWLLHELVRETGHCLEALTHSPLWNADSDAGEPLMIGFGACTLNTEP